MKNVLQTMQTESFSRFWHSLRILKVITVWCLGSDWAAPGWEWGVRPGRRRVRSSPGTGNSDKHEPYLAKCHQQTVTNCPLNIKETLSLKLNAHFHTDIMTENECWSDQVGMPRATYHRPSLTHSLIIIATIHENPGHAGDQYHMLSLLFNVSI